MASKAISSVPALLSKAPETQGAETQRAETQGAECRKRTVVTQGWHVSGIKADGHGFKMCVAKPNTTMTRERALDVAAKRFPGCTITEDHEIREER